jgi:hypothetical protein
MQSFGYSTARRQINDENLTLGSTVNTERQRARPRPGHIQVKGVVRRQRSRRRRRRDDTKRDLLRRIITSISSR